MTDESFRSAGYALMTEINSDQKVQSKRKTYAPVSFGSNVFSPSQLKMLIYSKVFLAIYMAFLGFAHILCGAPKSTIVLIDNRSVTASFQTKTILPSLSNACDCVLQFNFKKAHIAGSVNTAADFLSRLELKVTEKIHLKIWEDVQTTPIKVQHIPQMLQMKNSSSLRKQMVKMKPRNRFYNEISNLRKRQQNG